MDSWSPEVTEPETANIEFISTSETDRRRTPREDTSDLSSLKVGVNGRPITCLVHNISATGAMIETSVSDLPQRFILDNPTKNIRALCRIVWSCRGLSGVEFINADQ